MEKGVMAKQQREETNISLPRRITSPGLAELLDLSPDALVVIDQEGTMIQMSRRLTCLATNCRRCWASRLKHCCQSICAPFMPLTVSTILPLRPRVQWARIPNSLEGVRMAASSRWTLACDPYCLTEMKNC